MVPESVEGPSKLDNFKLIKFTAQQSNIIVKSFTALRDKTNKSTIFTLRLCGFA